MSLGANNLTIGGNNLDTTFSGTIKENGGVSGTGGSLTKLGTGMITITGAGIYTGDTIIDGGMLAIANAGSLANGAAAIGFNAGFTGAATIDGFGTHWTNNGQLSVGSHGYGMLMVSGGAAISTTVGVIAGFPGSTGDATVAGAGSQWTSGGNLFVGSGGVGTLTISNGGSVSASGLIIVGAQGAITGNGTIIGNVQNGGLVAPGTLSGRSGSMETSRRHWRARWHSNWAELPAASTTIRCQSVVWQR